MDGKDTHLVSVALPDGQCRQRFFLRRIYRYAEFRFHLMDGGERTGYVTAFDNYDVQISTSESADPKAVLIPWSAIVDIEETGVDLSKKFPDTDFQSKIKSYTRSIKSQAEFELNGRVRPTKIPFESPVIG